MRNLIWIAAAGLGALTVAAQAQVAMTGSFTATVQCSAYSSIKKSANPGNISTVAGTVYKLLGKPGLVGSGLVQDDEPIVGPNFGTILQYRLDFKHTLNQKFWEKILDFADAQLKE